MGSLTTPESPSSIHRLSTRLSEEGRRTLEFFGDLTPDQMDQQIYTTGTQWTPLIILRHLLATENALQRLLDDILKGGEGAPQGFNIVQFNEEEVQRYEGWDEEALLAGLLEARGHTISLVGGLLIEDLNKSGHHPWFGTMSIESLIKLIYRHSMIHRRDIRKALKTGQPVPHSEAEPPVDLD